MVEVDRVDVGEVDERSMSIVRVLARLDRLQLVVGETIDVPAVVELVAVRDLLARDLDVLLRAPALDLDRRAVLLVQLAEVQVAVAHGAVTSARAR